MLGTYTCLANWIWLNLRHVFIPRLPTCLQIVCELISLYGGVLFLVALACLWNRSVANRLKLHILYNCPCPPPLGLLETFLRGPKPPRGTWLPYRTNQHHQHHQIYSPLRISQFLSHRSSMIFHHTLGHFPLPALTPWPQAARLGVCLFACLLSLIRWLINVRWLFPCKIYVTPRFHHHSLLHVSLYLWFAWVVFLWVACFARPEKCNYATLLQGTKGCPVESTARNPEFILDPTLGSRPFVSGLSSRAHIATSPEPQKQKLTDAAFHFDIAFWLA